MPDWWSYRIDDFLMFAPRTYWRLFELYNTALWPGHLVAAGLGLLLLAALARGGPGALRVAFAILAAAWLWVAWAFHLERYTTINWAAPGFALAFVLQGLLLAAGALGHGRPGDEGGGPLRRAGLGLLLFALAGYPMLGVLSGRPWTQVEVLGLAPDPTVLGTLGMLAALAGRPPHRGGCGMIALRWLWPIPLLWCAVSAATLWSMRAPEALLVPVAALLALFVAVRARRR